MQWYRRWVDRRSSVQLFQVGFWGRAVFDAFCDISAERDFNGQIPKAYADPAYLMAYMGLKESDLPRDVTLVTLLNVTIVTLVTASLLRETAEFYVIDGWERRNCNYAQSSAERVAKYRERQKKLQKSEDVTLHVTDVTPVTLHVTDVTHKKRREEKRKEDPVAPKNEATSETTTAAPKEKKTGNRLSPEEAARRKSLITALEALFSRFMGSPYTWAGGRDFQALKRLMAQHPDPVILLRWERGLLSEGWLHTSTIAQLALKFNDLAKSQSATQSASADIYDPEKQRARIAAQLAEFEPRPIRMVPRKPEPQESEKTHDDA